MLLASACTRWRDGFRQPADIFTGKSNKFPPNMHTQRKKKFESGKEADHYGVLAVGGKRVRANSNKNWSSLVNLFHAWWSGCMAARSGQCGLALKPRCIEQEMPETRDGILERHFQSKFICIISSLLRLEFLSGFLPAYFYSTKCYSWQDSDLSFCLVLYPHFFILQNAIHEKTRVFLSRGFFC